MKLLSDAQLAQIHEIAEKRSRKTALPKEPRKNLTRRQRSQLLFKELERQTAAMKREKTDTN